MTSRIPCVLPLLLVSFLATSSVSGSHYVPRELVGTWFRPGESETLTVTSDSVAGRSLASHPWQYLKLTWDLNVFSGPGKTKDCMKCYRMELLHRNVIKIHANKEDCIKVSLEGFFLCLFFVE